MRGRGTLDGWERYPENLEGTVYKRHDYNFRSYFDQFKDDSERLFVAPTEPISLKVLDVNQEGICCKDAFGGNSHSLHQ